MKKMNDIKFEDVRSFDILMNTPDDHQNFDFRC